MLNVELPYDPAISLLGIHMKELRAKTQTDTCTPCLYQHYSQQPKGETQMPTDRCMDEQNVAFPYNGILLSL